MRRVIREILLLVAASLAISGSAYATVQCSCDTIKADGEGNTSCSTAESNDRCTIDFNIFGQREVRAQEMMRSMGISVSDAYPTLNTAMALEQAEARGGLLGSVMLYLSVAAVDQATAADPERSSTIDLDQLYEIEKSIVSFKQQIENAFSQSALRRWVDGSDDEIRSQGFEAAELGNVTIADGCIEVRVNSLAVMFKAYWSPARVVPRCSSIN